MLLLEPVLAERSSGAEPCRECWVSLGIVLGSTRQVLVFCQCSMSEVLELLVSRTAFRSETQEGNWKSSMHGRHGQLCELCPAQGHLAEKQLGLRSSLSSTHGAVGSGLELHLPRGRGPFVCSHQSTVQTGVV